MTPGKPVKYKVQLTKNFVILGHFLPFQPTDKILKLKKKHLEILSIYTFAP